MSPTRRVGPAPPSGNYSRGILFALISFFLFSLNDAIARLVTQTISPLSFASYSTLFAAPILIAFFAFRGEALVLKPQKPWLLITRTLTAGIAGCFAFSAFQRLPLADAYVFIFTVPFWVTALSVVFFREHVGWRRWAAMGVGFLGVLIAFQPGKVPLDLGHGFALGAAFFASLGLLIMRVITPVERRFTIAIWQFPGMILIPLVLGLYMGALDWNLSWRVLGLLFMSGVLVAVVQLTLIETMRSMAPSHAVPMQYSQIIWGVIFGWMLFGDWPQNSVWLGLVLIVGSGLYTWHRERIRLANEAEQTPPARL